MRYFIAVDGGQTHSLAIVANDHGDVLGAGTGGPANHFLEPGGEARFVHSMQTCINGALTQAGIKIGSGMACASYYALTGVHHAMAALLQQIAPSTKQTVTGDKDASLIGATLERPAVLVLAGTGAIAYALDVDGKDAYTGGWGYLMGDEGSASWIAPRALSAATQSEDGRGPSTILSQAIPHHFGVDNLRSLHPLIYQQHIDRVQLASVAKIVGEAALAGDRVSLNLLTEAGEHLGTAAVIVMRKLALTEVPVIITTAGGVFKAGEMILAPMMARIHAECPLAHYEAPTFPPVIGALFLALQSAGLKVTEETLAAVRQSKSVWDKRK